MQLWELFNDIMYRSTNTCNSGGSGFSWWAFQDGWYFGNSPHEAHWGMLERGYATGNVAAEKPMVNVFRNYSLPTDNNSCGPSPVDETTLQSYNPALTYFNPFQHPSNPQYTIKGYIYDQDGNPIANAYVGGHTNLGEKIITINNILTKIRISEFQRNFTDNAGYFELIPYDYIQLPFGSFPTILEGQLHTLSVTTTAGERLKFSQHWWQSNYCSNQLPPANDPTLQWSLQKVNFTYHGEINNVLIPSGTVRDLQAYRNLTVENTIIEAGASSEIMAPVSVHLKEMFHAKTGSETHVFCVPTSINCSDYLGYVMEYKVASNLNSTTDLKPEFIDLNFIFDIKKEMLRVYPNPANEYFVIESDGGEVDDIEIYNFLGELIARYKFQGSKLKINCSYLPQGVYMIKSTNLNQVYKFIKQ